MLTFTASRDLFEIDVVFCFLEKAFALLIQSALSLVCEMHLSASVLAICLQLLGKSALALTSDIGHEIAMRYGFYSPGTVEGPNRQLNFDPDTFHSTPGLLTRDLAFAAVSESRLCPHYNHITGKPQLRRWHTLETRVLVPCSVGGGKHNSIYARSERFGGSHSGYRKVVGATGSTWIHDEEDQMGGDGGAGGEGGEGGGKGGRG